MKATVEQEYYQEGVTLALSGYQLIEASLKLYLRNYFKIAKYLISDQLHFGFDGTDYDNAALGQLVKAFSKTCSDKILVSDLKKEISYRNHIAHKATLERYKKEPLTAEEFNKLSDEIKIRIENIKNLRRRLKKVHLELNKIFDD